MRKGFVKQLLLLTISIVAGVYFLPAHRALAAPGTQVEIAAVEYYEEQVIILNNGNSKIYYASEAEAAKENWEIVDADSGKFTMIDISWLSPTVENILVFRGDKDQTKTRAIIGEKPTKLEVSIDYSNINHILDPNTSIASLVNIMTSVGTGDKPVTFDDLEWRKGDSGQWTSTRSLTVGLLKKYLVKGTYLYFRIRAVDDVVSASVPVTGAIDFNLNRIKNIPGGIRSYENTTGFSIGSVFPDGSGGRRFSNEVKVKVTKQSTSMAYDKDGEKFTVEIKYGKEYRVTVGSYQSGWIQITDRATKFLYLTEILKSLESSTAFKWATAYFPAMKIEIRDYATSKAASSKITEINLKEQRSLNSGLIQKNMSAPDGAIAAGDKNIYISYNGNNYMVIEIPSASPDLPYEYCVFKKDVAYDNDRAVWTSITKGTAVKVLASKAVEGGTLYIRQKEIQDREKTAYSPAVDYEMASTYVSQGISYPSIPEIVDASYTFTKGYSDDIVFTATLNALKKDAFETEIASIKLGTRTIDFTAATATAGGIQTMTITLKKDSLATMTNCFGRPIAITFKKGTVDKTSIKLTIQSPVAASPLIITSAKGTNAGTTSFTVVTPRDIGNTWAYVVGDTAITGVNKQDVITDKTAITPNTFGTAAVSNITVGLNQYLTVFELDSTNHIVKYKCFQITSDIRL